MKKHCLIFPDKKHDAHLHVATISPKLGPFIGGITFSNSTTIVEVKRDNDVLVATAIS